MEIFWLILAYLLGSFAVLNIKAVNVQNYINTHNRNIELQNENNLLKATIAELAEDIENKSRQITVDVLQEIIKNIQTPQNKETK